jgi:mannose-6-phosphate isomerase-like protein (cupin superfamily)
MSDETFKPWGKYEDIFRSDELVLKKITVDPKQRLSLQNHLKRSEFWVVTKGECLCETGVGERDTRFRDSPRNVRRLRVGECVVVACGEVHRLINDTPRECQVVELQWGDCKEGDIHRLEDDYERGSDDYLPFDTD